MKRVYSIMWNFKTSKWYSNLSSYTANFTTSNMVVVFWVALHKSFISGLYRRIYCTQNRENIRLFGHPQQNLIVQVDVTSYITSVIFNDIKKSFVDITRALSYSNHPDQFQFVWYLPPWNSLKQNRSSRAPLIVHRKDPFAVLTTRWEAKHRILVAVHGWLYKYFCFGVASISCLVSKFIIAHYKCAMINSDTAHASVEDKTWCNK